MVQTKKKEDLNQQKSLTKKTLDALMDDKSKRNNNSINNLLDNSLNREYSSKMSESMSNINLNNNSINEIGMNVFTYFDPRDDGKIYGKPKKRISIKDFIFLLEHSNEYIPDKNFLLNQASALHLYSN